MKDPRGAEKRRLEFKDVSLDEPGSILRFALWGRVDALGDRQQKTRAEIAELCGYSPSNFYAYMAKLHERRETVGTFVQAVQRFLQVHERFELHDRKPTVNSRPGRELAAFRLALLLDDDTEPMRVQSTLFDDLVAAGPARNAAEVLIRSGSLASFRLAGKTKSSELDEVRDLLSLKRPKNGPPYVDEVLHQLVTVLCLPHGDQHLAVTLAAEMGEWIVPVIGVHLRNSPIGWRASRVFARMLRLNERNSGDAEVKLLFNGIETELNRSRKMTSPDPARCFFEEALRRSPGKTGNPKLTGKTFSSWSWKWVPEHLIASANDPFASMRLRSYSALCLAKRDETESAALEAAASIRESSTYDGAFAADMIEKFVQDPMGGNEAWNSVTNETLLWMTSRREWFNVNGLPSGPLGTLPASVSGAAQHLVLQSIFSIDATRRRQACDALAAGGAADEAAALISLIVMQEDAPLSIKDVGAVVLGYLGEREGTDALVELSKHEDAQIQRSALMALGELHEAEPSKYRRLEELAKTKKPLTTSTELALAYALAVENQTKHLSATAEALEAIFRRSKSLEVKATADYGLKRLGSAVLQLPISI